MTRILITGAAGKIGSALRTRLRGSPIEFAGDAAAIE